MAKSVEKRRKEECKFARHSPWELPFPLSTLSTSTSCQSSLPCRPSAAHPNARLGAGLCIFNKFRESLSKPAILAGGYSEGGFSAASQTVSSRLFMCEAFAILLVPHFCLLCLSSRRCPSFLASLLAIPSRSFVCLSLPLYSFAAANSPRTPFE